MPWSASVTGLSCNSHDLTSHAKLSDGMPPHGKSFMARKQKAGEDDTLMFAKSA